eukprot:GHVQ01013823.1.p1 GENE.GHVQ01013823.1~~GHVQ01013823.1.p1  ORF type:complete len:168 (-),score=22.54 GHVQ01013823.1:459-962(-)
MRLLIIFLCILSTSLTANALWTRRRRKRYTISYTNNTKHNTIIHTDCNEEQIDMSQTDATSSLSYHNTLTSQTVLVSPRLSHSTFFNTPSFSSCTTTSTSIDAASSSTTCNTSSCHSCCISTCNNSCSIPYDNIITNISDDCNSISHIISDTSHIAGLCRNRWSILL